MHVFRAVFSRHNGQAGLHEGLHTLHINPTWMFAGQVQGHRCQTFESLQLLNLDTAGLPKLDTGCTLSASAFGHENLMPHAFTACCCKLT